MRQFRSSYLFLLLGFFFIRMARYYCALLSVNPLGVKLSLKLHMNTVKNLLSTALRGLLIITSNVSSFFLTWTLILKA